MSQEIIPTPAQEQSPTPREIPSRSTTPRLSCKLTEIDTTGILRTDLGNIDELVESIQENVRRGLPPLIHPIVLTADMKLLSGSRRLEAHRRLGLTEIDYHLYGLLDDAERVRIEVDANKQKEFNWKEKVLGIDKYHRAMSTEAALASKSWGVRETGKLIGASHANVGRAVFIAEFLHANDPEVCAADSMSDAFRILLKRREDELSKKLVQSTIPSAKTTETKPKVERKEVGDDDFFAKTGTTGFVPGIGTPQDLLDERPGDVGGQGGAHSVVPLSEMFFRADSIDWCRTAPAESFDAVITDWPYGIDMDMLNQQNPHGQMKDIEDVMAEHTVEGNESLHATIIPLLYRLLKPNGWFITWTDQMQWQRNYDLCRAAGFKVQRWPLTWHKTSTCMNQSAQYNFTKNTEIAIVCRKGAATLVRPQASCVWSGSADSETKLLGHPFAKPFGLWEWIYNATCLRGARVLDPFMGSGSSTIPAIRMGLRPVGVEVNEKHFATAMVNVQNVYKALDPNCQFS